MGKVGRWINDPDGKKIEPTNLSTYDRWFIPYGSADELPTPTDGYYWELAEEIPTGRVYVFLKRGITQSVSREENLEQLIKDREETIRDQVAEIKRLNGVNSSQHGRIRHLETELNQAVADKKSITEAFDKRGVELEASKVELKELRQKYDDLYITNRTNVDALHKAYAVIENYVEPKDKDVETEKEGPCINPEYVETENLHKERMRLENESIELDNQVKKTRIKYGVDYPAGIWESHDNQLQSLSSSVEKIGYTGVVVAIAFAVNEVIQWLTL